MEKVTLTNGTIIYGEIIEFTRTHKIIRIRTELSYTDKKIANNKIENIEGEIVWEEKN